MYNEEEGAQALDGLEGMEDAAHNGGEDFGPQSFNRILSNFAKVIENMASITSTTAGGHSSAEMDRQVNNLPPHKDGVDIEKYIRKLEADLRDIGEPPVDLKLSYSKSCSQRQLLLSLPHLTEILVPTMS